MAFPTRDASLNVYQAKKVTLNSGFIFLIYVCKISLTSTGLPLNMLRFLFILFIVNISLTTPTISNVKIRSILLCVLETAHQP